MLHITLIPFDTDALLNAKPGDFVLVEGKMISAMQLREIIIEGLGEHNREVEEPDLFADRLSSAARRYERRRDTRKATRQQKSQVKWDKAKKERIEERLGYLPTISVRDLRALQE